jgi:hypothetical protein
LPRYQKRMRIGFAIFLALFMGTAAAADPLSDSSSPEPVLPDPVPGKAPHFPPQLATAGVALPATGAARVSSTAPVCGAANPCAAPTPQAKAAERRPGPSDGP